MSLNIELEGYEIVSMANDPSDFMIAMHPISNDASKVKAQLASDSVLMTYNDGSTVKLPEMPEDIMNIINLNKAFLVGELDETGVVRAYDVTVL